MRLCSAPMTQLVAIAGAPGTGKTTLSGLLRTHLSCPFIELGHLLRGDWSDENEHETAMAFENLAFIGRNYLRRYLYISVKATIRFASVKFSRVSSTSLSSAPFTTSVLLCPRVTISRANARSTIS
jgi:hypothetical protein